MEELGLARENMSTPTEMQAPDTDHQQDFNAMLAHAVPDQLTGDAAVSPHISRSADLTARYSQNRIHMLRRLRRSYRDLLAQSLQGVTWMELGLAQKPGVVQNATNLFLRLSDGREQPWPSDISILDAYDEAEHELLILGEPGAGKSTLLLDLAQRLVTRAEQDNAHPLPIILPLSLWAIKRPAIQDWACEQLSKIYDIPRKLSEYWMQTEQILLLLDGLDEMETSARVACIAAINTYHRNHLTPLVVGARTGEYELAAAQQRLMLQSAVSIQPLTPSQLDTSLDMMGQAQADLRQALQRNATLREVATTPLMLNILLLTYRERSIPDFSAESDQLQQQVWIDYVQRMVTQRGDSKRFSLQQTYARLGWLARQMRAHNMTVFYLEHMQPDWLEVRQKRTYALLAVLIPGILIGILVSLLVRLFLGISDTLPLFQQCLLGGFLGGVFSNTGRAEGIVQQTHSYQRRLIGRLALSGFIGVIYGWSSIVVYNGYLLWWQGYISGIMMGGSCLFLLYLLPALLMWQERVTRSSAVPRSPFLVHLWQILIAAIVLGVGTGLSLGLVFELRSGLNTGPGGLSLAFSLVWNSSLLGVLSFGLTAIVTRLILLSQGWGVHLTERLRWSWRSLLNYLLQPEHYRRSILLTIAVTLIASLGFGLLNGVTILMSFNATHGLVNGPSYGLKVGLISGLSYGLGTGLSIGFSYWLLFGLFQGIVSEQVEDHDRRNLNQGIKRSLRNGLLLGVTSALLLGVIGWLSYGLSDWANLKISLWLANMPASVLNMSLGQAMLSVMGIVWFLAGSGGLLACIMNGGLTVWRHGVIRFCLWQTHAFPWRTAPFFDDATARILLQRFGGGYSFMHRLLLDHFADQDAAIHGKTIRNNDKQS